MPQHLPRNISQSQYVRPIFQTELWKLLAADALQSNQDSRGNTPTPKPHTKRNVMILLKSQHLDTAITIFSPRALLGPASADKISDQMIQTKTLPNTSMKRILPYVKSPLLTIERCSFSEDIARMQESDQGCYRKKNKTKSLAATIGNSRNARS